MISDAAVLQIGLTVIENDVGTIVPLGDFISFGTLGAFPGERHWCDYMIRG